MMILSCWSRALALALAVVLACLSAAARADELAAHTFKEAKALYSAERYDEALKRFMDTYVLQPSPSLLHNIAMAHWKQGQLKEAHSYFLRFLKDGNLSPDQRATTERNLFRVRESAKGQGLTLDDNDGTDAEREEARRQAMAISAEGRAQYRAGNYVASVDRFRTAYLQYSEPRILQNLAMAYVKLGKKPEAVVLLNRYREEGNLTAEQKSQVDALLSDIQQGTVNAADGLVEDETDSEEAIRRAIRDRQAANEQRATALASAERVPVYKKWWFWTAITGGAIAVSLAIALPIVLTQRANDPCTGSDWCVGVQSAPLRSWNISPSF